MTPHEIYNIVARIMRVPVSEINDTSGPKTIESWDSFQKLILINDLEVTFDIKFTVDDVLEINTVADIKKKLSKHNVLLK